MPANWKTSLAGLCLLFLVAALLIGRLSGDQFTVALGVISGIGLLAAKDAQEDPEKKDTKPAKEPR
jgi:hypothetical protein